MRRLYVIIIFLLCFMPSCLADEGDNLKYSTWKFPDKNIYAIVVGTTIKEVQLVYVPAARSMSGKVYRVRG